MLFGVKRGSGMKSFASILAVASLANAPVAASVRDAALSSSSDRPEMRTSMFAGATYRVGFNRKTGKVVGRASLKIAGMTSVPGSPYAKFANGFEITGGKTGQPALHLRGMDIGEIERKASLSTGATIAIGVGVLSVAGVIILATYCDNDCENAKGE